MSTAPRHAFPARSIRRVIRRPGSVLNSVQPNYFFKLPNMTVQESWPNPSRAEVEENLRLGDEQWHAGKLRLTAMPRVVTIETTSVCNLKCVMCPHGLEERGDYLHFPEELVEKLRPILRLADVVQLHGLGEPLMNPAFWSIVGMTHKGQHVAINTNGVLVNRKNADRILDSWLGEVCFSIDAATPGTYARIRGADFDTVTGNIRHLVEERARRGQAHPLIHMNMTMMRENIEEVPAFIHLASDLGVDKVMLWHMNTISPGQTWVATRGQWTFDYHEQHLSGHAALSNRIIRQAVALADALKVKLELDWAKPVYFDENDGQAAAGVSDVQAQGAVNDIQPLSPRSCDAPWKWMLVQISGVVQTCCFGPSASLGNLNTSSAPDIWNGYAYRRLRRNILSDRVDVSCAGATCKFVNGRPASDEADSPFVYKMSHAASKTYTAVKKAVRGMVGESVWGGLRSIYRRVKSRVGKTLGV